ncbi:MAG: hypothetical protein ACKVOH_03095 [Chlamydiales bacterium]
MASPTGKASPEDQKRIEELRQHIEELIDEMTFYQIRWDSLVREGNVDASRELRQFDEGFAELQSEIVDLQRQLHTLEAKNTGMQVPFILLEESTEEKERKARIVKEESSELIALQHKEFDCIEEIERLEEKRMHGDASAEEQLNACRTRLAYIRSEITAIRQH